MTLAEMKILGPHPTPTTEPETLGVGLKICGLINPPAVLMLAKD